jgi:hypothetical protein
MKDVMWKDGRTWKLKRKSYVETETGGVSCLLDSSQRNENKEEQVEEGILRVMYISISISNL